MVTATHLRQIVRAFPDLERLRRWSSARHVLAIIVYQYFPSRLQSLWPLYSRN